MNWSNFRSHRTISIRRGTVLGEATIGNPSSTRATTSSSGNCWATSMGMARFGQNRFTFALEKRPNTFLRPTVQRPLPDLSAPRSMSILESGRSFQKGESCRIAQFGRWGSRINPSESSVVFVWVSKRAIPTPNGSPLQYGASQRSIERHFSGVFCRLMGASTMWGPSTIAAPITVCWKMPTNCSVPLGFAQRCGWHPSV